MYSRPSTSHTRAPRARSMNRGVPPTALNARTGELTPPGISFCARANKSSDLVILCVPVPRCRLFRCRAVASLARPAREVLGVVGQDHVGSRAGDGGERLQHGALLVH